MTTASMQGTMKKPTDLTVKPPPAYVQDMLLPVMPRFDVPSNASARTHYGRVVEELVVALLGLVDIPNSGSHDVVFDAYGRGTYCEVKSIHATGSVPIYEWRRAKDRAVDVPLVYVLAIHRCRGQRTSEGIYHTMASTLDEVLVVPRRCVQREAPKHKLRQLVQEVEGTRMGYKRKGYCKGYRNIPLAAFRRMRYRPAVARTCELYGLQCTAQVRVHVGLNGGWEALAKGG